MKSKAPKSEYRRYSRELHARARALGFKMIVQRRKVSAEEVQNGGDRGVSGSFCEDKKKLTITMNGKNSRGRILFVMAHELRHAEHATSGMFPEYYNPTFHKWWDWAMYRRFWRPFGKIPSLEVAHAAELDCDRFAQEYVRSRGFKYQKNFQYPIEDTSTYKLHEAIRKRKAEPFLEKKDWMFLLVYWPLSWVPLLSALLYCHLRGWL
jgi:hypothetical protein